MKLKQLFNDDDAVSPVIGVILMVAITVILAAVIATFVLGLGEQVSDTAPESSFEFDYNGTEPGVDDTDSFNNTIQTGAAGVGEVDISSVNASLTITHTGGPNIAPNLLGAVGSNASQEFDTGYEDFSNAVNETWSDGDMSAGNSVTIFMEPDDSISVVWTSQDGSSSATLRTFDGPEA